ncbi:NACHT, LRR and PYD domains-containing protein 3-like [Neoarius graeffei]|uniref:NACHT, LRR and PYD domains-containing protein 3-like n=1 Tax=Neoarius graeffei TaxID=443677 RepID=UPI00298C93B5|nr:NACHT, LRR and PYD domains-containing protein 3-like [Neoarius graeffei]
MSGECEEITATEMSLPEGKCKNQGATEKRPNSPEVSCVSLKSGQSMSLLIDFKGGPSSQESEMKERPVSPGPSCVSFQSDDSMTQPLRFTDGASSVERTPKQEPENSCRNWMESVFQLEHKVITLVKNELNNLKKLLSADYPECSEKEEKVEEEDLDRIRESVLKITLRILKNLKQKDLAHQLQIKLASVYQRKLKSRLGDKFKRINEGISQHGTSVLLNQIYTELYITEGWSEDISDEHEVRQIETVSRRPVTEEKPIKCNDLFKDMSIRSVLTKGVAGIGKTVSVQKFILDWTEGKVNQDVTFMFPLPFRELNLMKQQNLSLMNLLHQFFPDIKGLEVIDSDTYKILLIFDGLDECRLPLDFQNNERLCDVTESASVDVLLTNLIKGNLLPCALLWITTRPAAASQIPPESVDQATEVRGFSDPQKEEYFRKKISDQSLANKIITHMKSSRSLDIMCHIPVFCWISATVLERMLGEAESGEIPKTLTQMFTHFLIFQIKHKGQKYHGTYDPDPQQTRESILALGKLAFQQLEKGNLIFYEEDLRECGIGVREVAVYSGVCTQIFRKESGLHLGNMFSFVHLSIQEFLAALYAFLCFLDKNSTKEQTTALSGLFNTSEMSDFLKGAVDQALQSDTGHLDLFLRFLLGLSVESNQKLIRDLLPHTGSSSDCQKDIVEYIKFKFEQNPSPERLINLFYCLNELNDDSLVKEIQSYMSSGRLSEAELSPAQWSALVFVLLTSDEDLEVFQLQKFIKSDECFKRLLPVVQQATTALLSDCNLTERSCSALHTVLSSESSKLTDVDLSSNHLEDSGVKQLCVGLESPNCKLEKLRLSDCSITEEGYTALAEALRLNPSSHLRELDLRGNNPGASGVKLLTDLLQDPDCKLEKLRLRKSGVTEEGCSALTSSFLFNPAHIKELDLSENKVGNSGVQGVCALLKHQPCNLQILRLSDCRITEEGYAALAEALKSSHLMELDLRGNDPGASGVKLLTDLLQDPDCKLTTLRLCNCSVAAEGCAALAAALEENPSQLRELDLSGNKAGDSGIKHISNLLQNSHCLLETLKLRNSVSETSCTALASALCTNPSHIRELDLSGCKLGDSGVEKLCDLLKKHECKLEVDSILILPGAGDQLLTPVGENIQLPQSLDTMQELSSGGEELALVVSSLTSSSLLLEFRVVPGALVPLEAFTGYECSARLNCSAVKARCILKDCFGWSTGKMENDTVVPCRTLRSWRTVLKARSSGWPDAVVDMVQAYEEKEEGQMAVETYSVSEKSCTALASALCTNPSHIRELDLGECELGDSGVEKLCDLLKKHECKLETLRLSDCNLTERSCSALHTVLSSESSKLTEVDLSSNHLEDSGVKQLCVGLESPNCKLEKLRLSDCSITEEGYTALAEALRLNPSLLKELDLSMKEPGDSGVKKLSALLEDSHCKFQKIRLCNCSVAAEGCAALAAALEENPSQLRELDLSGNKAGDSGIKHISNLLQNSHCLLETLKSTQPDCHLVKFADDTVLLSLLSASNPHHGSVLQDFISWCEGAGLQLNSNKTKELIVTFSIKQRQLAEAHTTTIRGELVEEYKYLGTIFDSLLRFSSNTEEILKKCHQRQYLLRKLRSFGVNKDILLTFYHSFIESQTIRTAHRILHDPSHTLHSVLEWLPSGRRLRCPRCRTQRRRLLKSAEAEEAYNLLTRMFSKNPLLHTELDLSDRKLTDDRVDQLSPLLQDPHYRLQKLT